MRNTHETCSRVSRKLLRFVYSSRLLRYRDFFLLDALYLRGLHRSFSTRKIIILMKTTRSVHELRHDE